MYPRDELEAVDNIATIFEYLSDRPEDSILLLWRLQLLAPSGLWQQDRPAAVTMNNEQAMKRLGIKSEKTLRTRLKKLELELEAILWASKNEE